MSLEKVPLCHFSIGKLKNNVVMRASKIATYVYLVCTVYIYTCSLRKAREVSMLLSDGGSMKGNLQMQYIYAHYKDIL